MNIFLDESGNLTHSDGKYFIVGSYTVGDPKRVAKAFRKWQKSKFPRKLKDQSEVKFNDPHIDEELRFKTIKYLAKQDIRIFYTYLKRKNIPEEYRKEGKVVETGLLYTEIVSAPLDLSLPISEKEFRVFRDSRSLKGIKVPKFNEMITVHLLPQLPAKTLVSIQNLNSASSPLIQVADWVCGALLKYHEKKLQGTDLFNELKRNIIQGKELFSEYWTKRWNNHEE